MVLPLHVHIDLSGTEKCSICYSIIKEDCTEDRVSSLHIEPTWHTPFATTQYSSGSFRLFAWETVCWDTAYFSPTALLWNHPKSSETVAILDDTSLRVLLSQNSQQDTEVTWGSSFMKWQVRVENLNRNYSHNLFSCFSSFKKKKRIHIKNIKKTTNSPIIHFFLKQIKTTQDLQEGPYYLLLLYYCFFSGASLCCVMCLWVEQRFLSFTLWPHTRFVSYAGKKGVLLFFFNSFTYLFRQTKNVPLYLSIM